MGMDKSAADAYVYAKASGMIARSFTGPRAVKLFQVNSLHELWNLLFDSEVPAVPEKLLVQAIETEAQSSFISDYIKLLQNYEKPDPMLVALLQFYEYSNLKEIGSALCFGKKNLPVHTDIAQYSVLHYDRWPDLKAITDGTEFAWYDKVPEIDQINQLDYRLDCQYIKKIWKFAHNIHDGSRNAVIDLLQEKYSLENIIWALRLKFYYGMESEEIKKHLSYVEKDLSETDPVAGEAMKILDYETDSYEPWEKWKYHKYLNPNEDGVVWNLDPIYFATSVKKIISKKARHLFHMYPDSVAPLFSWFMLKDNELDMIRMAGEALRLNANAKDVLVRAGLEEVNG